MSEICRPEGSGIKTEPAKVLTIAGSDSGGAAGLQADLKTFAAFGAYGMSAITAVTAQNSLAVTAVSFMQPDLVGAQIEAVIEDYGAMAVKTGFIGRKALIEKIAHLLSVHRPGPIVVDPVLVNHRGEAMFSRSVVGSYRDSLMPLATLVSPNCAEAGILTGVRVNTVAEAEQAAMACRSMGASAALITGLRQGDMTIDLFMDEDHVELFRDLTVLTNNTHGSGDALSAGIAVLLAQGHSLGEAVSEARVFVREAIERGAGWRLGRGHGPLGFPMTK